LDYEKSVLYVNNKINSQLKTVYFVAPTEVANISSSLVKSLIGLPEWQFVVEGLIPKANMSSINAWYYGGEKLTTMATDADYDYQTIIKLYSAPGRYYHTLQHLAEMLHELKTNININMFDWRSRALRTAAVWHDAVYSPLAKDNEEKSVELFLESTKGQHDNPETYRTPEEAAFITALILATKNHESEDPIHNLFIDCDLAILAFNTNRFNEYERQIRAEYSMAPDAVYNKGRAEFVEEMLKRPKIFLTQQFEKRESAARANLKNLLEKLR
jgi:predicted metal-dependent HD superfamily phosphohydrolase